MNRSKLKTYSPQARRDFIQAVTDRAAVYGLTLGKVEEITEQGDVAIIGGKPFPIGVAEKRRRLEERIKRHGFAQVMEATAYTWFNRLVAIRYMEIHGYLDHGYRVLSNPKDDLEHGKLLVPEIVEHAEHVDLPGLDKAKAIDLKLEGTKEGELYQMLLLGQCHALHKAMPFLFERIDDETELLLPDNLLHSDSIIRNLVSEIEETDWQAVEIIGWLYQFYISEKKDEVIGKVVKSEDIPAATQLFTPNWIVKYLVQNSLGRQWMATYPQSALKAKMEYYIEPAEQTPEVQAELKKITPESLNPEELTLMDPACGSGHILVEAYDLLKEIYLERGYRLRDIPKLILSKNLFGLEIDDRAAQLAAFALMMKARADDRRIFDGDAQPSVLAIQESNGLNVNAIVQAFTEKKITKEDDAAGEFGFMGAVRAPLFATEHRATATVDEKLAADLKTVFALFENAKTFGSLTQIPPKLVTMLPNIEQQFNEVLKHNDLTHIPADIVKSLLRQTLFLANQYDAVVTNPPYMGARSGMNSLLKGFVSETFPLSKSDLYAMFIERSFGIAKPRGYIGMVTMHGWMFLSTFEEMRQSLLGRGTLQTLAHLGPRAFGEISGEVVQVTAFSILKFHLGKFRPTFFRLVEGQEEQKKEALLRRDFSYANGTQDDFQLIAGSPMAYWASRRVLEAFQKNPAIESFSTFKQGMATSDNGRFLRLWYEVSNCEMDKSCRSPSDLKGSSAKWFPYNKGGSYRKWYGNNEFLVNWKNDGQEMKDFTATLPQGTWVRLKSREFYCLSNITYSALSSGAFGCRLSDYGFLFDTKGSCIFANSDEMLLTISALLNSAVCQLFLKILCPTLDYSMVGVKKLPAILVNDTIEIAREACDIAKTDWDSSEESWDFQTAQVLLYKADTLEECSRATGTECTCRFNRMQQLEERNNRIFIDAYGLQDELSPEVPDDQITLYRTNREEDNKRLLSYTLGCAMGRYSLDKPGLLYANSGNKGFDPSQYKTFSADKDGIIPVTEIDWFPDAASCRFEEFVGVAWPKEHLDENLKFVADSLGTNNGEQPRDTIRRYFADDFYKHHLQTYKRRPIYWLFTSGKLGAFQCLVYLHRYNEGTLARMRTEYVIPLQGKINARIDQLEGDKDKATAPAHRKRLEKEQELLKKQQTELVKFDEKLRHYADQRIKLDLDDGVKVNYAKFGDLLACVTQVCGKGDDDE